MAFLKSNESVADYAHDVLELTENHPGYKTNEQYKNNNLQKETYTSSLRKHYIEIEHDLELGYHMGVYLCIGQQIYEVDKAEAKHFKEFKTFESIQNQETAEIAVLVIHSDRLHSAAKALYSGDTTFIPSGMRKSPIGNQHIKIFQY